MPLCKIRNMTRNLVDKPKDTACFQNLLWKHAVSICLSTRFLIMFLQVSLDAGLGNLLLYVVYTIDSFKIMSQPEQ
jgi:hypothetical protein